MIQNRWTGYREFCSYLENPTENAYNEAVERMKISTRQYAKRQISWIRNKLIPAVESANSQDCIAPLYLLDATGEPNYRWGFQIFTFSYLLVLGEVWQTKVQTPAINILEGELIFIHSIRLS